MTRPSGQAERIERIIAMLDITPSLRLRELARHIGVTEMTVRRDAALPNAGFTCRGGYLVRDRSTDDYDFEAQISRAIDAKRRAAEHAMDLVPQGANVFLDTGTTLPHLARLLSQGRAARILTHCLTSAEILQGRSIAEVEFIGGTLQSRTRSCHPRDPGKALRDHEIGIAFLSAGGFDRENRLSCSHEYEVSLKRAVLARADTCYVIMDESKRGVARPFRFATSSEVAGIVTEAGVAAKKD